MKPISRRGALLTAVAVVAGLALVQPAAAAHKGAIVDCGDAGTFTIRAQSNAAGFEAPLLAGSVQFEEGGLLTPLVAYRNGALQWGAPDAGLAANALVETTCTFTIATGYWEITGILLSPGHPAQ